jgi:two-component system, cell cycle sensor histidine kinase and response regulator CckA
MSEAAQRPFGVLVVEDKPSILEAVTSWLRGLGAAAFGASGCDEAERVLLANAGAIDAALIDLRMPNGDGLETRRRLHGANPGLPCVLMTGEAVAGDDPPEGFCHTLAKPFGAAELDTLLRGLRREG